MGPHHLAALLGAAAFVASGCGDADSTPALEASRSETGVVAGVTDGDTLVLRDGRRVRLVQIDAPERGECFFAAATRALERLAQPGTTVRLRRDPDLDSRDDYGRLLRYVRAGDVDVNIRLVADGAAAPYFFRGERGAHATRLLSAAKAARGSRRGFWGACPGARLDPNRGALTGRG